MNVIAGEADLFNVPNWNIDLPVATVARNLTPFLRRIVFVGETTLGTSLNVESVGLSTKLCAATTGYACALRYNLYTNLAG